MIKTSLSKVLINLKDRLYYGKHLKGRTFMRVKTIEIGKVHIEKIMDDSMRELLAADIFHTFEKELEWRTIQDKKTIPQEEIQTILDNLVKNTNDQ